MKNASLLILVLGAALQAQVTYDRLLRAPDEPQNWLTYSGRYSGWRYSTLREINTSNASRLAMQWVFQVGDLGQFETTLSWSMGLSMAPGRTIARLLSTHARDGRSGDTSEASRTNFSPVAGWSIAASRF